jgi:chromate reductase
MAEGELLRLEGGGVPGGRLRLPAPDVPEHLELQRGLHGEQNAPFYVEPPPAADAVPAERGDRVRIEGDAMAEQATELRILGIAGSLRAGSLNRALLRAARELAPPGMRIDDFDIAPIPAYNADVEAAGDPPPVAALKQAIREADALLFATPEYNYGIPGVLKNAIDWASRPPARTPLRGKPAAIMGASVGSGGTIRAQLALRQCFVFTQTLALLQPEVLVAKAEAKFDAEGRLVDEPTRGHVHKLLEALRDWTLRLRAGSS